MRQQPKPAIYKPVARTLLILGAIAILSSCGTSSQVTGAAAEAQGPSAPAPASSAGTAYTQTLQRCIGVAAGQPWPRKQGPNEDTIAYCRQLPKWSSYEQAQQQFLSGDHAAAAQSLLPAAQAGNGMAALRLAIMYDNGDGVPVNKREAFRWYLSAAQGGEPASENEVGSFYEAGEIVRGDWVEAVKWFQQSAQYGWIKAEFSLGQAYEYGVGVPVNLQTAIQWYSRAAAQGHQQGAQFASFLRDNHGLDASTFGDDETDLYNSIFPGLRTLAHTVQAPAGALFHNKTERLNFMRSGLQRIAWNDYDNCINPLGKPVYGGPRTCIAPPFPRP